VTPEIDQSFLTTLSGKQWQKIGLKKRAGVATPLFSIYSKRSIGIGELPDLKLLVDWCEETGMSILQLLPMNDVGFNFRPYDAKSSFALDPMHLSIPDLQVDLKPFRNDLDQLKKNFPTGKERVNYEIKPAKLSLLRKIFSRNFDPKNSMFGKYVLGNSFWLRDYVLFTVINEKSGRKNWELWENELKNRNPEELQKFESTYSEDLQFQMWLQWQLFEQFRSVKKYAGQKQVLLMGDLPFLVSRDSADVWSHQNYFKLDLAAGAPPDAFLTEGQRWGMPPYEWEAIARHDYNYVIQKLRYAQNFYDLFRVDHVVGIFRLWTIPANDPLENSGLNGVFDPKDENLWEDHGRKILSVMIQNTDMLPCAEDLGVVPDCSSKVLEELGMVGTDVIRWKKNWKTDFNFTSPENYRKNSIAVFSTHDMTSIAGWWQFEAGTVDEKLFKRKCEAHHVLFETIKEKLFDFYASSHGRLRWRKEIDRIETFTGILNRNENEIKDLVDLYRESYDEKNKFWNYLGLDGACEEMIWPGFIKAALDMAGCTASLFSIQLLQDWLALSDQYKSDPWNFRINFPGTIGSHNWSIVMPCSLEEILALDLQKIIKKMNRESGRI